MKLLFDQNISYRVVKKISDVYPEAVHIKQVQLQDKIDKNIWLYAKQNGFAVVTFDGDFFELSNLYGHPPKIIWLRTGNTTKDDLVKLLLEKHAVIKDFLTNENFNSISCIEIE